MADVRRRLALRLCDARLVARIRIQLSAYAARVARGCGAWSAPRVSYAPLSRDLSGAAPTADRLSSEIR